MSCDVGKAKSSFSNLSVTSTYVIAHSPTLPLLYLHHSSFSNPSVASPTSQLTAHSPSFHLLHLLHSSFPNPSLALPTSQLILQPFRCFTYITANSPTLLSLLLPHRIFTYVTWWAAHVINGTSSDIMILYSVASPPLTLPTYPFSHYATCIVGCVVRCHREATLSTWLPMP